MSRQIAEPLRELDHRTSDGLDIRMLWSQQDDQVLVTVNDRRNGEEFCIEVRHGEVPHDVFHHPYAYAAQRGISPSSADAGPEAWIVHPA